MLEIIFGTDVEKMVNNLSYAFLKLNVSDNAVHLGDFDMYGDGSWMARTINVTCVNHPDGKLRAVWDPYYHHEYSIFPKCHPDRKYRSNRGKTKCFASRRSELG
jgi:hypothetical protein